MQIIDALFRLRRRLTGADAAPADHLRGELAVSEVGNSFWYGFGAGTGNLAASSHLLFRSDGARLWHTIVGAADGSTVFTGVGSGLTGVVAASAATLTTARNINGTSFNGSVNITTTNWGTSRTITIGATGKAVNGGSAVSWSLAEIGAAAAAHGHVIADVTGLQAALDAKQPAITTTEAALSAAVDLTSNNTWFDAVTLSLAAGTWLLTGHITLQRQVTNAVTFQARISDNTTHFASGQQYQASQITNNATTISLSRVVTLGATTTVRLQGLCVSGANSTDNRIVPTLTTNASGDTATVLTALRIA